MTLDHYEVLGIDRLASMTDVRRAFRQRALENHPDKNPRGETLFKQVAAAYQVCFYFWIQPTEAGTLT